MICRSICALPSVLLYSEVVKEFKKSFGKVLLAHTSPRDSTWTGYPAANAKT